MTRVRIEKIEITNFKNVGFGSVNLSTSVEGEQLGSIKGIYGQNGSGKTSLITAVGIVKDMLSGIPLPSDIQNYIKKGENQSSINIEFSIRTDQRKYDVFYELIIGTENSSNNSNIIVKAENIKYRYSDFTKDEDQIKVTLLNVDYSNRKITPLTKERFYNKPDDFIEYFIKASFSVNKEYNESWEFIKRDDNSMNRFSNFDIFLKRIDELK